MRHLTATVRARETLLDADVEHMYALFERYYDATTAQQFRADLAAKSHVIELREGTALRGFSTIALIDFACGGAARRAVFSGDTIIDHRYWGEQTLPLAFCRFAGQVHASAPHLPLYWFLISKGYRTYRYLPAFAQHYYPRADTQTPPDEQTCLDRLAQLCFGACYTAARGVVHFARSRGHLKPEWAGVRPGADARRDVQFFLQRNPGYRDGDELVCITRLRADNLRSVARRAFLQGMDEFEHAEFLSRDRRQCRALSLAVDAGAGGAAAAVAGHPAP